VQWLYKINKLKYTCRMIQAHARWQLYKQSRNEELQTKEIINKMSGILNDNETFITFADQLKVYECLKKLMSTHFFRRLLSLLLLVHSFCSIKEKLKNVIHGQSVDCNKRVAYCTSILQFADSLPFKKYCKNKNLLFTQKYIFETHISRN